MEVRLIDANALLDKCENLYMRGHILFHGVTAYRIENAPTIDPEILPVVHELRDQLERVTRERDAAMERAEKAEKQLDDILDESEQVLFDPFKLAQKEDNNA